MLHVHEEIISNAVEKLVRNIIKEKHLKHPIIVDKNSFIILDGMHRVAALEELGYPLIPICLADYRSSDITVQNWVRTITQKSNTVRNVLELIENSGCTVQEIFFKDLTRKINEGQKIIGIVTSQNYQSYEIKCEDIIKTYKFVSDLESKFRDAGYKISYETERAALRKIGIAKVLVLLLPPRLTKKDIIDVALAGKKFVHKATRHIIQGRIMNTNVPLKWLKMTREKANKLLVKHLSRKKMKLIPQNKVLEETLSENSRVYEEDLLMFYD